MTSESDVTTKPTYLETTSGFGAKAMPGDKHLHENSKEELDRKLDDALNETLDASDPVSVKITK